MDDQPTAALCTVCRHKMHGTLSSRTTCPLCEDWTRDTLAEIERLWLLLPEHLHRGRGAAGPRISGNTKTAGAIPPSEAVLDLMGPGGVPDRLAPHLTYLCASRLLLAPPITGTADYRVATIAERLRRHLPWAVAHHDLKPLALELRKLVRELRAATGQARDTKTLGTPCPACGGALHYDRTHGTVSCGTCGHALDYLTLIAPRAA